MIKFFQKLRYDLMEKNKIGKYLKYAFGEIVLVVIGILVALQINTWNEERKTQLKEEALYNRVILDLQIDEKKLNEYIQYYKDDQSLHASIYQETQGVLHGDSLIHFGTLRGASTFNLIIQANYSKSTEQISSHAIREKIENYFRLESFVDDAFKILRDYKAVYLRPYLAKHGINNSKELFENYQLDYYSLREISIFSYPKLKEQYGTVELDQLLFDLGIKTAWSLTALNNALMANKELQLDIQNELIGKPSTKE